MTWIGWHCEFHSETSTGRTLLRCSTEALEVRIADLNILSASDVLKKRQVSDFQNGEALSGVQTLIFLGQNSEISSALDIFLCGGVAYIIADF